MDAGEGFEIFLSPSGIYLDHHQKILGEPVQPVRAPFDPLEEFLEGFRGQGGDIVQSQLCVTGDIGEGSA